MRWNHLPVPGGIYAQHPQLLSEWQVIFEAEAEHEKREREKAEAERKRKSKTR